MIENERRYILDSMEAPAFVKALTLKNGNKMMTFTDKP